MAEVGADIELGIPGLQGTSMNLGPREIMFTVLDPAQSRWQQGIVIVLVTKWIRLRHTLRRLIWRVATPKRHHMTPQSASRQDSSFMRIW